MKKKISILGSTGSIGKNTLKIIKKDIKNFEINLLTTNKNINIIFKQAKEFKVKNLIITDLISFEKARIKFKKSKINIYNNFNDLNKIFLTKNDIIMSSITGISGLLPTLKSIKYTKKILIANKESIICGWNLIMKELNKHKTKFIPVDSEHFSIWFLLNNYNKNDIEKIFITASGGPFLNLSKKKFSKITLKEALRHPNWSMGKKITIDSATLMNKVFEVIEAKNIFNLSYNKISILTHPHSYLHAIIKFKNGLIKLLMHDPDMKIPIFNSIYDSGINSFQSHPLNLKILNNLNLNHADIKKFESIKLLNKLPNHSSLFETILVTINDYLVHKFLNKKINFQDLNNLIYKISNLKEFIKYKRIKPQSVENIYRLRDYVSTKLENLSV
jgi:1-deoxy-D-xylulose-5-phosphate reductoisomerase